MELLDQLEGSLNAPDGFTDLPDVLFVQAVRPGGQAQVAYSGGIDLHDPAAGCVYRHHVSAGDQYTHRFGIALNRPVAFHSDDAVHDGEVARERRVQIGDTLIDACPVQHVLGPAVNAAGHEAEEILHAERGAHPVVRLHFWQGDQQVGRQSRVGKVNRIQSGKRIIQQNLRDVV